MEKVQVALADTFWTSFARLPKAQSKKLVEFITKFRQTADSSGINYEKIKDAAQPNFRSVRIDQAYRGIVLKPERGRTYVLLWVDHHDDAYAWAKRTRCEVHPDTGVLQLYESEVVDTPRSKQSSMGLVSPGRSLPTPLFELDQAQLSGIGVPASMYELVLAVTSESELETLQNRLPVEAFEALYLFADGVPWGEIWEEYHVSPRELVDPADIDAALARDASKRRFRVIGGELELEGILAAPLEKWRVFLHPTQRRLVERHSTGPVRVLGGAGTGKTVVAMHRAVWLARNVLENKKDKVLFLTFNTNLAKDIEHNLSKIATAEDLARIEIVNIDAWVSRYLRRRSYPHSIVGDRELNASWNSVIGAVKLADPNLPDSFFKEEWERVILPNRVVVLDEYLRVSRRGRGVPLNRKQRAAVWPVFGEMRQHMHRQGWRTYQDATLDALDSLKSADSVAGYRSVVVDEAQDMGPEALCLIRQLAPEGENDLFLVGDGHQRIYRKKAVMGQCGIRIVGRSRRLKINYRTTEQIRRFASALLEGLAIDDLDGEEDPRPGYRSLTQGAMPEIQGFRDISEEADFIAQQVRVLCSGEKEYAGCCLVLRRNDLREQFAEQLRARGLPVVTLDRQADNQRVVGVRLATMHRVKGLEFRHVFLAGMSNGVVPNPHAIASRDPVEAREGDLAERALVHVAASRSIERLFITHHGSASVFLAKSTGYVRER
jgi:superfamily I DNA/RNA helicase